MKKLFLIINKILILLVLLLAVAHSSIIVLSAIGLLTSKDNTALWIGASLKMLFLSSISSTSSS